MAEVARMTGLELKTRRQALTRRMNRLAWASRDLLESQGSMREHYQRFTLMMGQWDRLEREQRAIIAELGLRDSLTREQLKEKTHG